MTSGVEPAKKILLPYLQRADELQKHELLVAYYCRLYAMECGLKIPIKERTKTTSAILVSLMSQLEKDKKSLQLSPEDNLYVEGFALNVFAKADKQDRAGRADLNTAKTFYAASIFIEILHQFGSLQPDLEQKQKYAVWKAADIRKALNEGRRPTPGPPGEDEELSISPGGALDLAAVSPNNAAGAPEGRTHIQQASNMGFGVASPSLDGGSKLVNNQALQPDHNDQNSNNFEHRMQQLPLDSAHSGYTSPYPGSYYPSSSMSADTSAVSPTVAASQYGSRPQLDAYNGQPHNAHYHEYVQTSANGSMYPSVPTTYIANNGGSDVVYYQSQGGYGPSAATYPASAPDSADYGSFEGLNGPSGLERTASASVASFKGQTYQPAPDKIAEAQKAARFAVSALAFDDVPTAVSYLKQSLELLTNPAAA